MFRIFFILLVVLLFSCSPQKKEKNEKEVNVSTAVSGITSMEFEEEFHDLESLISGEIVVSTFVFTNVGEHNLLINNIESDCGCVSVHFSKEPVKPGDSGIIEIEFDSSGLFGQQFKSIEIHANTKDLKHLAIFASVKNEDLEIKY